MELLRTTIREKTFTDVVNAALKFNPTAAFSRSTSEHYADAVRRAEAIVSEMATICAQCRHPPLHVWPPGPVRLVEPLEIRTEVMRRVLDDFAERLERRLLPNRIGRIEWYSRHECRIIYYEHQVFHGVFGREIEIFEHEHELVAARLHALPALEIRKPRRALAMIRALDLLHPYARILTGTIASKRVRRLEPESERTLLGRVIDEAVVTTSHLLREAASAIPRRGRVASAATGEANGHEGGNPPGQPESIIARSINYIAAALKDPALVLGDRVLTAWEETT